MRTTCFIIYLCRLSISARSFAFLRNSSKYLMLSFSLRKISRSFYRSSSFNSSSLALRMASCLCFSSLSSCNRLCSASCLSFSNLANSSSLARSARYRSSSNFFISSCFLCSSRAERSARRYRSFSSSTWRCYSFSSSIRSSSRARASISLTYYRISIPFCAHGRAICIIVITASLCRIFASFICLTLYTIRCYYSLTQTLNHLPYASHVPASALYKPASRAPLWGAKHGRVECLW